MDMQSQLDLKKNIKMVHYVCGFCFNPEGERVVLIEKNRPKWQSGLLNGVGGKIEENELIHEAMEREFLEETGVIIKNWKLFCKYEGEGYTVYFHSIFSEEYDKVESKTDEHVSVYTIDYLNNTRNKKWAENKTIDNLKWLIPMALDSRMKISICFEE